MPVNSPYYSPNWAKRMMRLSTPKEPRAPNLNDPAQMALGMFNQGMRAGADGTLQPVQDYGGMLQKASQGVNSLTRGVKGGQMSSLGKPMNSMYEQNPGFFNRGARDAESFGQMLAQSRQQRQAPASTGFTRPVDGALIEKRGFDTPVSDMVKSLPSRGGTPAQMTPQQEANRTVLEEAVSAKKLLQAVQNPVTTTEEAGKKTIQTPYGSGSSTQAPAKRKEGLIGGRPFSEVMQGLANKPGIARKGDKFQPQQWNDALKRAKTQ